MSWPTVPIAEVTKIVSGATPKTSVPDYWAGDICWATPADLSDLDGAYIDNTPRKISAAGLRSCAATVLPVNSVLFSSRAPIGHVALNTAPMATNQGFKSFVPDAKKLDPKFLYWWLKTHRTQLEAMGNGATFKEVSKTTISRVEIPLPPLDEQKRIAAILDKADQLRQKRRQAIALLDSLTQSIFLEMFGDPVSNPKGWTVATLGELFDLKHGFAFKSENFVSEGPYVLLTPGNFFEEGGFRHRGDKQRYHCDPVPNEYVLEEGDTLIAMTEQAPGLLGSPIVVPESGKYLHNQRLGKVVKNVEIDNHFIFELMNTASVRARIQRDSTGTKVKHTSPTKIGNIVVGIPSLSLQKKYSVRIEEVLREESLFSKSLLRQEELFTSLQHRAFTGQL